MGDQGGSPQQTKSKGDQDVENPAPKNPTTEDNDVFSSCKSEVRDDPARADLVAVTPDISSKEFLTRLSKGTGVLMTWESLMSQTFQ